MTIRRKAWAFAIIYLGLSLGFEASLIIFGGLGTVMCCFTGPVPTILVFGQAPINP